jgi:sugar-specific transcriptional regulator TrmB
MSKELIEVAKQALQYLKEGSSNKPHFIKHAEATIKKAEKANSSRQKTINAASDLLCAVGDKEITKMIKLIAAVKNEREFIDYVGGVIVWEKIEMGFTCESFLEHINYHKEDF